MDLHVPYRNHDSMVLTSGLLPFYQRQFTLYSRYTEICSLVYRKIIHLKLPKSDFVFINNMIEYIIEYEIIIKVNESIYVLACMIGILCRTI